MSSSAHDHRSAIAIVGLGCRVPGADSPDAFWRNLRDGVESVRRLTPEELLAAGLPLSELANPKHVGAAALLSGMDLFDAAFFGVPAREAELMDPQHRIFLECAWEALEDAGCDPARFEGAISVFGGGIFNSYVTWNLLPAGIFDDQAGTLQTVLSNEKDYMTARVAYKLNLRGAACNVQTGCSTSLVAVHMACQSLLNFESDLALAGGVAIDVARRQGYYFHEGSVFSPDGHCRSFDADARGTVFGNGAALVALKRLEDAIAEGDPIRAVILGTAINNDGSLKVGFTAPSVAGQSQVIAEAMSAAGVEPDTINYVEAHGTGTALGDPIEIQAMAKAFGPLPSRTCAIGSVKTNIGHLDAAAGVSGLIKTVLALENRLIPATLHHTRANPELELHRTPFMVAAAPLPWTAGARAGMPRRAGVSSFGIGGTNAHAVIEEAPALPDGSPTRPAQLLVLSARSGAALDAATGRLADFLRAKPDAPLADVAFTLQTGRGVFSHRRALVCRDVAGAVVSLETAQAATVSHEFSGQPPRIGFMFPGQGAQYPGMARRLYETEPVFRREFDGCAAAVSGQLDLLRVIHAAPGDAEAVRATDVAQPALFAVSYALAQLWRHWGIEPDALIGHSVGEYVAAALAGVFSRDDAMRLVAERGRLMQEMPAGSMTAVPLPPSRLQQAVTAGLDIAAINAPSLTIVSGPAERVERFETELRAAGVECRRLHTSHAFHSAAMDAILDQFAARVRAVGPRRPERRFVSNVTGAWITPEQAMSPQYWAQHLRGTVLFSDGIETLAREGIDFLIEIGPGRTLGSLVRAQQPRITVAASAPAAAEQAEDHSVLLDGLARAWVRGADVKWAAFYSDEQRRRVPLPTYPFERIRHWIEPDVKAVERRRARARASEKNHEVGEWLYAPSWKQTPPVAYAGTVRAAAEWLVLSGGGPVSRQVVEALERAVPAEAITVIDLAASGRGKAEQTLTTGINPSSALRVVHLGAVEAVSGDRAAELARGFYSVAGLGAPLARARSGTTVVKVVTSGTKQVFGTEPVVPARAAIAGPCFALQQEQPHVRCEHIDVAPGAEALAAADLAALVDEILSDPPEHHVAVRGGRRWTVELQRLEQELQPAPGRERGHYLVVGGLGTIGFTLAWSLARLGAAHLSIVSRTALPPRGEWQALLNARGPADPVVARTTRVASIEKLGCDVLPIAADAADTGSMQSAIAAAEARFGPLHGVITAAGLMDDGAFSPLDRFDAAAAARHLRPKVDGLPALAEALGSRPLDFCIVTSSLSSVLGGFGYAAYAGANAFLDAFVHERNRHPGTRWSVVNWDAWHPLDGLMASTTTLGRLAMSPGEGASAFGRLLKCRGIAQVFVSTADLPARIAEYVNVGPVRAEAIPATLGEEVDAAAAEQLEEPLSPTERTIIAIWQQVLGVPGILVHDSFMDLGGSSLTAIQVIGRIDEQLGVKVTIEEFIFQTAGQLAALCDGRITDRESRDPAPAGGARATGAWARLRTALHSRGVEEKEVRT